MATSEGAYLKELYKLARNVDRLTHGQASVALDEDNIRNFLLFITPNDGHYKSAKCKFQVRVTEEYPEAAPDVVCLNTIYHPNIDLRDDPEAEASICVNLLSSDWEPGVGLDGCVMAVLFLLHNPNLDDALSPVFENGLEEAEFYENVRASLKGEEVEGVQFDKLIDEDDDDDNHSSEQNENNDNSVDNSQVASIVNENGDEIDVAQNATASDTKEDSEMNFSETKNVEVEVAASEINENHHENAPVQTEMSSDLNEINTTDVSWVEGPNGTENSDVTGSLDVTDNNDTDNTVSNKDKPDSQAGTDGPSEKELADIKSFNSLTEAGAREDDMSFTSVSKELNVILNSDDTESTEAAVPLIIDVAQLPTMSNNNHNGNPWPKVLGVFGQFYRWFKICIRPNQHNPDIYVISSTSTTVR